ncbi:MAG: ATP-binding protein [Nitrospinota bacterium]
MGLLSLGLVVYTHVASTYIETEQNILFKTRRVGENLANGHLWLEEYLSGDHTLVIEEVLALFDKAEVLTEEISRSKEIPSSAELHKNLNHLRELIFKFREMANKRVAEIDVSGAGTEIDQQFDSVYKQIRFELDAINEHADHHIAADLEKKHLSHKVILVLFSAILAAITTLVVMHSRKRNEAEEELKKHRDRLQELVDEQTEDLRAAKETAEAANKAKSKFLANVSHVLRTPLHQILGFADLGIMRGDTATQEKKHSYFSRIQESGTQMLHLVEDLIDLSKLDSGRMNFNMLENDLAEVVKTETMIIEKQLNERSLTINVIPSKVKTTAVFDAKRIRQVARNLFSNAIKFSQDGKTITVSFGAESLPGGDGSPDSIPCITMAVRDEGVGIPENEIDSIFDKFVQSSKTDMGAGGRGMGLAICKEIVTAHKGAITAVNRPDGGAIFKVTLPCLMANRL